MQYSKLIVSGALALALSALLIEASRYADQQQRQPSGHGAALSHYGGGAQSNRHAPHAAQYHSYAVRPAVYGGHRMYAYRGYARHYPAPARQHQPRRPRHQRARRGQPLQPLRISYNQHHHHKHQHNHLHNHHHYEARPKQQLASHNNNNSNNNHNNNNNNYNSGSSNNYQQPASKPEHLPAGYTLKPINALALVPIAHGSEYYNKLVPVHSNGYASSGNSNHNAAIAY